MLQRADSLHSMRPSSTQGGHFGLTDMACILGKIGTCFEKTFCRFAHWLCPAEELLQNVNGAFAAKALGKKEA